MGHREWWRNAVVYEVYLRSFADSDGDGVGDIRGLRGKLPYLADLGVDAVWVTPWFPSPMADGGYDVSDYCDIDPRFGTLADADALLADAHARGLRVIIDLVANHTSDQHPWFRAALAAGPGSPERRRYFFRDGRDDGEAATQRLDQRLRRPGVDPHPRGRRPPRAVVPAHFAPEQPDLDWEHPGVREDFDAVLRFWLDRGVDGLRVDAAPAMAKAPGLPDAGHAPGARRPAPQLGTARTGTSTASMTSFGGGGPSGAYDGDRLFVTEAVVRTPERLSRYVRPDEMHTSFNFDYLTAPWDARRLRAVVDESIAALGPVGAPATWVLSSHDETRHVTRFGRAYTGAGFGGPPVPPDRRTGPRPPPGPGGPALHPGAAGLGLPLPGGGARASRGGGPARGGAAGPDVEAIRPHRPRP